MDTCSCLDVMDQTMEKKERSLVELLLNEELEEAGRGLDEGLYSQEELDLPHNTEGNTPLITACQMGLKMVMYFLLERGADPTLCNHSNQTAVHVSQSDLQSEMMAAILRPTERCIKLLEVVWRGDIHALQHLLAETDSVDTNIQNQNGLTPLMLAVRDVDLFEELQGTNGWDYCPVEVVKELLALSVDVHIQDHKGYTALHYVSQIKSSIKEELLQIILEYKSQSASTYVEQKFYFPVPCTNFLSISHGPSTPVKNITKPYEYTAANERHKDKIMALCFHSAMEPKKSTTQSLTHQATGCTSSLPSLRNRGKCWTKFGTVHSTSHDTIRTSTVSISPRLTDKSKTILQSPSLSRFSQPSQSTSSLALLDAKFLLQVQTNIHNRLSSGEMTTDVKGQKGPLPGLHSQIPKHLPPLESGYRDGPMLSSLQNPLVLEPISTMPFGSKRFTRLSSKGSRGKGRGSEDSISSSCSSQSSLNEEEEEDEDKNSHQETKHLFRGALGREPLVTQKALSPFQHLSIMDIKEHKSNKDPLLRCQFEHPDVDDQMKPFDKTLKTLQICDTVNVSEQKGTICLAGLSKEDKITELQCHTSGIEEQGDTVIKDIHVSGITLSSADPEHSLSSASLQTSTVKHNTICKEGKSKTFHTYQSLNMLTHKSTNHDNFTSKRNIRSLSQAIITEMNHKDDGISEEVKRKAPTKNQKDASVNQRRTPGTQQHLRLTEAKKNLNKPQSQKRLLNRETRTARQAKKPGILGTQRAKSSLDYVSYSDMFLEIHQADEGPAIFEMFATPVYENLRAGSSVERTKKVKSAPPVKRKSNGQHRACKSVEGKIRKWPQKCTHAKGKHHKTKEIQPSEHDNNHQSVKINTKSVISGLVGNNQLKKCEILTNEGDKKHVSDTREETVRSPVLSVIEEVISDTAKETPISKYLGDLLTSFNSFRRSYVGMQYLKQKTACNDNSDISSEDEDPAIHLLPAQPLINTWTSDRTKTLMYKKLLDEVDEGPVTDDLLRCLAEELISLEKREVETMKPENPEMKMRNDVSSEISEDTTRTSSKNLLHSERSSVGAAITWTKGEVLGRGAYGTVYCGLTNQGQLIAVKQVTLEVFNSTSDSAKKEYDRLEREVDLLKNLNHPNIVGFLGTALSGNLVSILMEYIPGGSISNVLYRFGPLQEKVFALYTTQILEGVTYLHDNRIIHRDLKGNNIMLMPNGTIKLIDFGCARRLNCLTHPGGHSDVLMSVHGTPYWMAPEVIKESGHGKKSDIWSIGCTVFEMATGKPPLAHMSKMAALFYIGACKGSMPSLPGDFSEEAKGFVQACLIIDKEQRPSAAELLRHPFIFHHRHVNGEPSPNAHHIAHYL